MKHIRTLLREALLRENLSKIDFYTKNNIDPEELSYMGGGDFGEAFDIGDGRVLKITSSKSEFDIAKSLVGKGNVPALDGFAKFYVAEIVDNDRYIIMERLEEDSHIEDLYYQLEEILNEEGLPIQYLDNLDTDELDLDEEMMKFIGDMYDVNHSYRYLGIEASDIKPDNLGVDVNGKIKAFDIDDKHLNETLKEEPTKHLPHDQQLEGRKAISVNYLKQNLKHIKPSGKKFFQQWIKRALDYQTVATNKMGQEFEAAYLSKGPNSEFKMFEIIMAGGVVSKNFTPNN